MSLRVCQQLFSTFFFFLFESFLRIPANLRSRAVITLALSGKKSTLLRGGFL